MIINNKTNATSQPFEPEIARCDARHDKDSGAFGPYGNFDSDKESTGQASSGDWIDAVSFDSKPDGAGENAFTEETRQTIVLAVEKVLSENVEPGYLENEPLFRLAQYWLGILDPAQITARILEPFVKMFYDKHEELSEFWEFEDVMILFEDIWVNGKVKHPKRDTIGIAVLRAKQHIEIRSADQEKMSSKLRFIDNILYELQKIAGQEPIHLSQYQAGQLAGVSDRMGRRYLDQLERWNILKRVATGNFEDRLANSYFYQEVPTEQFCETRESLGKKNR